MVELWNRWYETLGSLEGLAAVVIVAVTAAGVLTLIEGRRHRTTRHSLERRKTPK